jgi:hypothetical protein
MLSHSRRLFLMPTLVNRMRALAKMTWPAAAVVLFFAASSRADAEDIVFASFEAFLYTGPLQGTTFTVQYSYSADDVSAVGDSYVPLISFDFTLLGVPFTRDDIFQGGQVIFRDGVLNNVTASFQVFLPPGSPVQNITFGFGGPGVIGYIARDGEFGDGFFGTGQ